MKRIGHRGSAGTAPENTLASFRVAVEAGVDAVELDVHRTRDGHLVVIHDPTLDRTTDRNGTVADLTLEEIRRADAGAWKGARFAGERVPTLAEVVDALPERLGLVIELKRDAGDPYGTEADLAAFIRARGLVARAQIVCFDHRALARVHGLAPELDLGVLYLCRPTDPAAVARACGARALVANYHYVAADDVAAARAAGLPLYVWTVNAPEDIAAMRDLGVDGIASDYPERL